MDQQQTISTTRIQQAEHALARYGHWLVLALLGAVAAIQKIQPGALNADVQNDVQMAMLVLGGTTVAAIVHSAVVQKALLALQGLSKTAGDVQAAANALTGAAQAAQAQVPPKS
jgi:hypothetical protein